MKYSDFIKQKNILNTLLYACGIYQSESFIIKVNHDPDYEMSSYDGVTTKDYLFKSSWKMLERMESVLAFSFDFQKIYHYDDFKQMSIDSGVVFKAGDEEYFINQLFPEHLDIIYENGIEVDDLDEFKLKNIRLADIDNEKRKVMYEGTFFGDSYSIDPLDWSVYSKITVKFVPNSIFLPFSEALIGESYTLYLENKNNLAFFILFSGFESFINTELLNINPNLPEEEGRLNEKVKQLFVKRFQTVAGHQIYESLMPKFDVIKNKRNIIAHGKQAVDIPRDFLNETYYFVLIFMLSYRQRFSTFSELKLFLGSYQP